MNKENIIDYVIQTPHNPNKKVLDDMLETLIEENGSAGSISPDWNQNDETASDYIKNRPFYEGKEIRTSNILTWDGNTEGLYSVQYDDVTTAYLISDKVPTREQVKEGGVAFSNGVMVTDRQEFAPLGDLSSSSGYSPGYVIFIFEDGSSYSDTFFDKKGTYFITSSYNDGFESEDYRTTRLEMNTFNGYEIEEIVVYTIPEKYIPDTILSDVTLVEEATDTANVLIEEGGKIKRVPKTEVGGGGKVDMVIKISASIETPPVDLSPEYFSIESGNLDAIVNTFLNGGIPIVKIRYYDIYQDDTSSFVTAEYLCDVQRSETENFIFTYINYMGAHKIRMNSNNPSYISYNFNRWTFDSYDSVF